MFRISQCAICAHKFSRTSVRVFSPTSVSQLRLPHRNDHSNCLHSRVLRIRTCPPWKYETMLAATLSFSWPILAGILFTRRRARDEKSGLRSYIREERAMVDRLSSENIAVWTKVETRTHFSDCRSTGFSIEPDWKRVISSIVSRGVARTTQFSRYNVREDDQWTVFVGGDAIATNRFANVARAENRNRWTASGFLLEFVLLFTFVALIRGKHWNLTNFRVSFF